MPISAHPFENPSAVTNIIQMPTIFVLGAGLTLTFGTAVGRFRQGWALLAAMLVLFLAGDHHPRHPPPPGLTIDIIDSGRGLPESEESMLFDRFRRVEGGDQQGGIGLGLAIVKGFAQAMGLIVAAANRGDEAGSRFSI